MGAMCCSDKNEQSVYLKPGTMETLKRINPEGIDGEVLGFGVIPPKLHNYKIPLLGPLSQRYVSKVSAGIDHFVFLMGCGDLYVCGKNTYGQLGMGDFKLEQETPIPLEISEIRYTFLDIHCGDNFTLCQARIENVEEAMGAKRAIAFGHEIGLGRETKKHSGKPAEVKISGCTSSILRISAKHNRAYAVDEDNNLYVWGERIAETKTRKPKHLYKFNTKVKVIADGLKHSAAVLENGEVYTWGDGSYGELGHGAEQRELPTRINSLKHQNIVAVDIACGDRSTFILDSKGALFLCGDNSHGECAMEGDRISSPTKLELAGLVLKCYAGNTHAGALLDNGSLWTWGDAMGNVLGHYENETISKPEMVDEARGRSIASIALGPHSTIIVTGLNNYNIRTINK